jgi:putative hydrolase of the HAD superfamily
MITTYLFDLDDTLIDTKIYSEIYKDVIHNVKNKLELNDNELNKRAKKLRVTKNKYKQWDTGELCKKLKLLDEYYIILEREVKVQNVLKKDVIDTLNRLKGKKIGIVSNSMRKTIQLYIKKYNLTKQIDFIFSSDDAKCKKNKLNYWRKLIKKEKLDPRECLVVGDDIEEDVKIPKKFKFNVLYIKRPKELKIKINNETQNN